MLNASCTISTNRVNIQIIAISGDSGINQVCMVSLLYLS